MRWWQNQGLNFKAALGISITMVIVLGILFIALSQYFRTLLWQSEIQKTENINSIAKTLLSDAMMAGRKDTIQQALDQLGQSVSNQQLMSIAVYDDEYELTSFASGFSGGATIIQQSSMPTSVEDPSCLGCHQLPPNERPSHLVVTVDGQQVIRNSVPLYNEERCQTCHGTGKTVIGDIMVDFSQEQFKQGYNTIMIGLGSGLAIAVILVAFILYLVLRRIVLNPLEKLAEAAGAISQGDLERQVDAQSDDEIGAVARAFNDMVIQLRELIGSLEQRVASRTQAIETTSEVSRRLSTILDLQQLVLSVVEEVQKAFSYYHVHIYFFDKNNENLVMAGGTGEAGRVMLQRQHSIPKGRGLVGRAAENNQEVLVSDTLKDPNWLPNPLLPDTRSELAVPITIGENVLGVLDVQQNISQGLSQQDVDLLRSVANQIALAVQNARAYTTAQKQAEREAIINTISQRIQSANTPEAVLQIAASELALALGTQRTIVQIDRMMLGQHEQVSNGGKA